MCIYQHLQNPIPCFGRGPCALCPGVEGSKSRHVGEWDVGGTKSRLEATVPWFPSSHVVCFARRDHAKTRDLDGNMYSIEIWRYIAHTLASYRPGPPSTPGRYE